MKRMLGLCGLFIGWRRAEDRGEVGSLRGDVRTMRVRSAALSHSVGNSGRLLCGVTCFLSFLPLFACWGLLDEEEERRGEGKKWANEKKRKTMVF